MTLETVDFDVVWGGSEEGLVFAVGGWDVIEVVIRGLELVDTEVVLGLSEDRLVRLVEEELFVERLLKVVDFEGVATEVVLGVAEDGLVLAVGD